MTYMTSTKHTVSAFDEELDALRAMILDMAQRTTTAMTGAIDALNERDLEHAGRIVAADREIDALHQQAEAAAVNIIALRAPMADDLRVVVAAIKISALLERTADYAKNIARRIESVSGEFPNRVWTILSDMNTAAAAMLTDVVEAYARSDAKAAADVIERDDEVDDLHDRLTEELLNFMIRKPKRIGQAAHLLFIGKHVERIGDQATNIAEMVAYAATGEAPDTRDTDPDRLAA